ncbi:MAG TPA: PPK2 family polyphosphate kinase [Candidatus Acidoferrales bacterium]|nr:PPK2 family polyphosphate kinase [Candidatus Acidoferrales bacterium]
MRRFMVKPGEKAALKHANPDALGQQKSQRHAKTELQKALERLDELQSRMWAEHKHALLIVLQGRDAAGKDSLIRHVISGMNPQGCVVSSFKQPTPEELAHDFLWRVHKVSPARGTVAVFNRSQYEDVLAARVHRLVPKKVWKARYREINEFEHLLYRDNDTTVLKFFLNISKEEQLARFARRLDDPSRNWKISESDYTERDLWRDYTEAFEEMFRETSTYHAPWFIIPANHKWSCHLNVAQILIEAMSDMGIKLPKPSVDLDAIRRKYHAEEKDRRS